MNTKQPLDVIMDDESDKSGIDESESKRKTKKIQDIFVKNVKLRFVINHALESITRKNTCEFVVLFSK